jgi:hypothetical protein
LIASLILIVVSSHPIAKYADLGVIETPLEINTTSLLHKEPILAHTNSSIILELQLTYYSGSFSELSLLSCSNNLKLSSYCWKKFKVDRRLHSIHCISNWSLAGKSLSELCYGAERQKHRANSYSCLTRSAILLAFLSYSGS